MLMSIGSLATIGVKQPKNSAIVVLDNGRYGETGMQPSHTQAGIDLVAMQARAPTKRKYHMTAAHKRKLVKALAKARKIRWAGVKGNKAASKAAKKKDRRSSPAVRAKLAAAARARWAKAKAAGEEDALICHENSKG